MTTDATPQVKRRIFPTIPVWPGAMLLLLLTLAGLCVRFWAWIEIAVRFWLFNFIIAVSGDLLGPQLQFTNLFYEYPFTVILQAPELSSEGDTFVRARRMRLTLEQMPVAGKPIQISEIVFYKPVVRFIWKDDGTIVGMNSDFIKSFEGSEYTKSFSTVPSDFLRIRVLDIVSGTVQFEPTSGESLRIDAIDTTLDAQPNSAAPGLYEIVLGVDRKPALIMDMDATFDIDNALLDIEFFKSKLVISPETASEMPADLQEIFTEYQIMGELGLRADGQIPFTSVTDIDLDIETQLERGGVSIKEYHLPIPRLAGDFHISDGVIDLEQMNITLEQNGSCSLTGHLFLGEGMPFDLAFDLEKLQLASVLDHVQGGKPGYSGIVGAQGEVKSSVDDVLGDLSGHALLTLSKGDLLNVPIVEGLEEAVLEKEDWPQGNDRGSMQVTLNSHQAQLDDIVLEGDYLGVRGSGEINYDGSVNFRFNAGPLEKVQMQLGGLGDVLGFVTDRLVTYQVTGTWEKPMFNGRLLGIGTWKQRDGAQEPPVPGSTD